MKSLVKTGRSLTFLFFLGSVLSILPTSVFAVSLNNEYTINVTTTQVGPESWVFQYDVTNINQQLSSALTGFDGLFIQIPTSATISNLIVPPAYYGSPGFWDSRTSNESFLGNAPEAPLTAGYLWLNFWGNHQQSVYPIGTTATFSFQADGVTVGSNSGVAATFWNTLTPSWPTVSLSGANYTFFSTELLGPTAVPIPAALPLLLSVIAGFVLVGRKRVNS